MKNLNPIQECNAREVEMMVGKAMCAYANWMVAIDAKNTERAKHWTVEQQVSQERVIAAHASEYEATIRIIEMFVSDSIYAIQAYVADRAEAELLAA